VLLPLAHRLVQLPEDYLDTQLTDAASLYNAGWSLGREKLGKDKPADTSKASFYFNPLTDQAGSLEDRKAYPLSYPANLWPSEKLPELEPACKKLGCLLKEVAVQLAVWIDAHALSCNENYPNNYLYEHMKHTDKVKGRLLYYYPLEDTTTTEEKNNSSTSIKEDSW
jgi:hypothetical protein